MSIAEAILSGIIQGITEFLPVSSSGHLVLVHGIFGFSRDNVLFDVALHFATLMSVLFFFRKDIHAAFIERNTRLLKAVIIGSIPAFLAGWLFRDSISGSFHELRMVGMLFLFTSFLLLAAQIKIWKNKDITGNINYVSALIIGIFQAGALLPGISRSGSTIAAGLLSGIRKDTAFRFSFYLAIPAVSGAMLYELIRNGFSFPSDIDPAIMAAGMLAAFIFGLGSLRLLRYMIRAKTLYIFSIYTFLLGMSLLTLITG